MKKTFVAALLSLILIFGGLVSACQFSPILTLNETSLEMNIGEKVELTVDISIKSPQIKLRWLSSDITVATVDENGTVTAVAFGDCTIFAIYGEIYIGCLVTVGNFDRTPVEPDPDPVETERNIEITDSLEFEAALEDQKDGDIFNVKNGTYELQVIITKNIKIVGESKEGVVVVGYPDYDDMLISREFDEDATYGIGIFFIYDCSAEVSNLTIRGIEDRADNSDKLREASYAGIILTNASAKLDNLLITNIQFNGERSTWFNTGRGIVAQTAIEDCTVEITNCKFANFQDIGIEIWSGFENFTFNNNEVIGLGNASAVLGGQNGITFGSKATIIGNLFKDLEGTAIFAFDLSPELCDVENNTFENVGREYLAL